ncbi:MAG TPA: septum formation initiator family protein [Candidatus Binatia bacterium]|jgi:cell division protein FtsB|nr:septum formation initiator family protein [Candidatus Binatia bacterium]
MHILRRLWLPVTLLLYALLAVSTLVGQHGLLHLRELCQEQQALEAEAFTLTRANADLRERIGRLTTDDEFLEKVAREELGFVGKGEIVYRFRDSGDAARR